MKVKRLQEILDSLENLDVSEYTVILAPGQGSVVVDSAYLNHNKKEIELRGPEIDT